jgi:TrmH family RNA methyltransferase
VATKPRRHIDGSISSDITVQQTLIEGESGIAWARPGGKKPRVKLIEIPYAHFRAFMPWFRPMNRPALQITSLQNPRIKEVVKLQKRPYRDEVGVLLVEGYREVKRMLDNQRQPQVLFYAPAFFRGGNETTLVERAADAGAELFECTAEVFQKIAYRDRPEGLLALTDQVRGTLADLKLPEHPLLIVAESIEKPGNLGSLLRSADAAGVHGVIVCDRTTDINNPNVVRSSIGTLFSLPVVEASSEETLAWLKRARHPRAGRHAARHA